MALTDLPEIDELLAKWGAGDREALRSLIPLIYQELRKVARQQLRRAPSDTLQTTALIHEAYMRLHDQARVQFQNKSHFIAVCALLMRQILVGYERQKRAAKRGGDATKCTLLEDVDAMMKGRPVDLLDLDRALTELAHLDSDQARIVELRFFGGFSIEETDARIHPMRPTRKAHGVVRMESEELTGQGRFAGFDWTAGPLPSVESPAHVTDRLQAHVL